jgi:enoyl-CoA hydratase
LEELPCYGHVMTDTWTEKRHGKIAVLTFARPPHNWMNLLSMTELAGHLARLATQTDEVTVVMLTGGVDGYFIAHADPDDLALLAKGGSVDGDLSAWSKALDLLETLPQPTVAAIDGQAWGGGCETALACTMRVASEQAHMGQPEVSVGIIPGAGGTQRLPRLVGSAVAAELCLSGRIVKAEEAHRIGLVNAVLPSAGFVEGAIEWCEQIARNPATAVFSAKEAVMEGLKKPLHEGLTLEGRLFAKVNASDEARSLNAAVPRPD